MYVRKFEADTLEDALKSIKHELGPDAIILKTITNKGIKGAFKKKKIEITAAISEKSYTKKLDVDKGLNEDQKEQFYNSEASYISEQINRNAEHKGSTAPSGYGKMGLNRQVSNIKNIGEQIKSGLDDFLSSGVGKIAASSEEVDVTEFDFDEMPSNEDFYKPNATEREFSMEMPSQNVQTAPTSTIPQDVIQTQSKKIEELEKKLFELTRNIERIDKKEPVGIYNLRTTLRSMEIAESYLQDLIKRALFEFSKEDLEDFDKVFEFALRDMMEKIQTAMPLFSSAAVSEHPVVTVLVSDSSSGQTSTCKKLASLKSDTKLIQLVREDDNSNFAEKMFNIENVVVKSIAEVISETRKANEVGKSVIVDFNSTNIEQIDTKKFVESIRRTFDHVEVLICLSAIHTELYNMKVLNKYKTISNGIVLSNLDLCLNFGALFNLSEEFPSLPYKFFGNGDVIPDDIESATAERILAGIFQLN